MVCSVCGKEIPNDSAFCPECGERVVQQFPVFQPPAGKEKYCGHCGSLIPLDSLFCPECGEKQSTVPVRTATQQSRGQQKKPAQPKPLVPQKVLTPEQLQAQRRRMKYMGIGLAGIVVLCLVVSILSAVIKPTANLNKYIQVEFEGYDTIGEATLVFDEDQFVKDHGKKLADHLTQMDKSQSSRQAGALFGSLIKDTGVEWEPEDAARRFLYECVSSQLDNSNQLSNGDVVTCLWECDEDTALDKYGYKLKYEDISFTVQDLMTPETFDPFEGVSVIFEGIAPHGTAKVSSEIYQDLRYELDQRQNLSNGDMVTVTVSASYYDDLNNFCLNQYRMIPSVTTKTFKVEGLAQFITSAAQISSEGLKAMQVQAEDSFKARAAKDWGDGETMESLEYVGNYLLLNKDSTVTYNRNILYVVYKATVSNYYSNQPNYEEGMEWTGYYEKNEIYWYVSYRDIVVTAEGDTVVDITRYDTPSNSFTIDSGVKINNWSTKKWTYKGYPSLEDLYKQVVSVNLEKYTHEDNVPQGN